MERTPAPGWLHQLQLRRGLPLRSQAVRRDTGALATVYERHHQALYRYCRSILHNDEDAHDALQSTMAKALAALREEHRDFELRPWLFRIAHNEAISLRRRRRELADPDAVALASVDSLAQDVENRERLAHLRSDLDDVSERQRAALVLRELSGLSHEEIAAVLGTTARSVKQLIFEARVALQECAEGRAMLCDEVKRALSDGDGRVLRGRRMRAHLRSCRSCRQFKSAIAERRADLAALAPALPAAAGAGIASSLGLATGAGGGVAATVATKAAVIVVVAAAAAGTTTAVKRVVTPSHHAKTPPSPRVAPRPARATPASASPTPTAAGTTPPVPAVRGSPHDAAHRHTAKRPRHGAGAGDHGAANASAKAGRAHGAAAGRSQAAPGREKSAAAHPQPNRAKPAKPAKPAKARHTPRARRPTAKPATPPTTAGREHGATAPAVPAAPDVPAIGAPAAKQHAAATTP